MSSFFFKVHRRMILKLKICQTEIIQASPRLCSFSAPTLTVKLQDSLTNHLIGCHCRAEWRDWKLDTSLTRVAPPRAAVTGLCFLHRRNVNICRKRHFSPRTHGFMPHLYTTKIQSLHSKCTIQQIKLIILYPVTFSY